MRSTRALEPVARRKVLVITGLALVIAYLLWVNPMNWGAVNLVMYPLRLFVTFIHEAGHSLAAIISGGEVVGFQVSADGSGLAITRGGNRALIISAGYLGAALFGSVLFYLINRFPRYVDTLAFMLGVFMIGFSILFARPDQSGSPLALLVGLGFGGLLLLIGMRGNLFIDLLVLNVLAVLTALNAVFDIWDLIRYNDLFIRHGVRNDAVAFSQEIAPLLPPVFIAFVWAVMAVVMLAVAGYYAVWRPIRAEVDAAYDRMRR
jgi:hypothetical protein